MASTMTPGTVMLTRAGPGPGTGLSYTQAADFCGSDRSTTSSRRGSSKATVAVAVVCFNNAPSLTSTPTLFVIQKNTGFTGNTAKAMNISKASSATASLFAKIVNDQIWSSAAGSVCDASVPNCSGIDVKRFGPATSALVSGKTINSYGGSGIFLDLARQRWRP